MKKGLLISVIVLTIGILSLLAINRLFRHLDEQVRNPDASPTTLSELSHGWAPKIHGGLKMYIAEHPNTPVDTLVTLSSDSDDLVRRAVASNPNLPEPVLESFVDRKDSCFVLGAVVANPSTPASLLQRLWNEKRCILPNFPGNLRTPKNIVDEMLQKCTFLASRSDDENWQDAQRCRELIRYRMDTISEDTLLKIAKTGNISIRDEFVNLENTSCHILRLLEKQPVDEVSENLSIRLKADCP